MVQYCYINEEDINNMKKILSTICLSVASYSFAASPDYAQIFAGKNACFILYDAQKHKMVEEYNPKRCNERIPPNSTFKVPLSLMAFDKGIISESTVFKWDGKQRWMESWNQNQTPRSWEQYSVLWVSQQLSPQIGMKAIKSYLADFKYGNQDFSGDTGKNNGLTNAWLSGSLKISALEQLRFLENMQDYQLNISHSAVDNTIHNIYLGKIDGSWDLYGKTGSGSRKYLKSSNASQLRDGYFIGYLKNAKQSYIIVTNISDIKPPAAQDKEFGGPLAKAASLKIIQQLQLKAK
jgi:beta-lactamase class D/beta-lactamase class D OXA-1